MFDINSIASLAKATDEDYENFLVTSDHPITATFASDIIGYAAAAAGGVLLHHWRECGQVYIKDVDEVIAALEGFKDSLTAL